MSDVSESAAEDSPSPSVDQPAVPASRPMKLWLPVTLVVLFWLVWVAVGYAEVANFIRFLVRAATALLVLLIFVGWWLARERVSLTSRLMVLVAAAASAVISVLLMDKTVLAPAVLVLSIPALLTGWVVWLVIARNSSPAVLLAGMLLLGLITNVPGALVRMEGMKGDGTGDFCWRWQPTAEQRFLQQAASRSTRDPEAVPADIDTTAVDSWTDFRGPQRDSTVPGITFATDWQQSPPQMLWHVAVGPGWSSMVVVGNHLFTQEQRGDIEVVSCYDANTGEQLWLHEDTGRFEENLGGVGPRATPTFADGRIYARSARGLLNCLDAATGDVIWSRSLTEDLSATVPTRGFSDSPLVVDDRVIVFAAGEGDNQLIACDTQTGEQVWSVAVGNESYSSPQLATINGQTQALFVGVDYLVSHDPSTGQVLWTFNPGKGSPRPVMQPRPISDTDLLVSFSPIDGLSRIQITSQEGQWAAAEVWSTNRIKPDYSDFVHYDGHLYGFDQNIFCSIDLATGQRNWKAGRYGSGQVLLFPDQPVLLVLSEQGELILLEPRPDKHSQLASIPAISGKTWNHPAVANGRLYVRNAEEMACFELPLQ